LGIKKVLFPILWIKSRAGRSAWKIVRLASAKPIDGIADKMREASGSNPDRSTPFLSFSKKERKRVRKERKRTYLRLKASIGRDNTSGSNVGNPTKGFRRTKIACAILSVPTGPSAEFPAGKGAIFTAFGCSMTQNKIKCSCVRPTCRIRRRDERSSCVQRHKVARIPFGNFLSRPVH